MTIQEALQVAVQQHRAGRLAEADAICRRILAMQPDCANALSLLGMSAMAMGHPEAAADWFSRAVAANPGEAIYRYNLGWAFDGLTRFDEAIAAYQSALALKADLIQALSNLGSVLRKKGRIDEAITVFRRGVALNPNVAYVHHNLGYALQARGDFEEAARCFNQAIALQPDSAESHNNLGIVLQGKGDLDAAMDCFKRAIALKPDSAEAHNNLGGALKQLGLFDQALAALAQAIALQPNHAGALWNTALIHLARGDFERGWPEFEWRLLLGGYGFQRAFTQPQWKGEDIGGRTILLHAEAGFGDTLHFVRYAPLVAQRGAKVLLECQPTLAGLLRQMAGVSDVIPRGQPLPQFDCHCPLQSLPLAFGTTLATIPAAVPYLSASSGQTAQWSRNLAADSSLRVGLAWAGNQLVRDSRSNTLDTFAPLAAVKGVTFYSLQKGVPADQPAPAGMKLLKLADPDADFADTAALMANLDLVISIDTSVAHLAGALGKPVWTLIPYSPDFRWLLDREDTPWYPTMRLFRQARRTDWGQPLQWMAAELADLAAKTAGHVSTDGGT